jgi:DNA polymerase I-like protein with 3'-5' exonuclease and polymerase domains
VLDTYGGNLQNKEAHMRRLYIPDEGKVFFQPDQDGAEARIVAHLTERGKYRELFDNDIKVHSFVSLHMFRDKWEAENKTLDYKELLATPISKLQTNPHWRPFNLLAKSSDNWPAKKRYYYLAKQTSHSANYGIRGPTFQMNVLEKSGGQIALTRKEADFFLQFYRSMFPEIPHWNYETAKQVHKTKVLYNLFGHPREFTGDEHSHSFDQEAYAFVPQSTVGELTHMAYRDTQSYIEENKKDWDLLVNTHDGLLCQLPKEEGEEFTKVVTDAFGREMISPRGEKFRMKIEIKCNGTNWSFEK